MTICLAMISMFVGFAGESKVVSYMYGKINVIVSNTN